MLELKDGFVLYHGSYCEVKAPDLGKCAKRKDFGQGFYLRLLSLILPELMEELRLSVAGTLSILRRCHSELFFE